MEVKDVMEIKEKTRQIMSPIKSDICWIILLLLAILAAYKLGVYAEKIGDIEDVIFNNQDVKNAEK